MTKLIFNEKYHTYHYDGKKFDSVTTFLKKFNKPFDRDYWANHVAKKQGITQAEVIKMWKEKSDKSCKIGNNVHLFAENVARGKMKLGLFGEPEYSIVEKRRIESVKKFWEDHNHLIPVEAECKVYNVEYQLAGMIDLVCKDDSEKYYLVDYKTNSSIDPINKYGDYMLDPVSHLDSCNLNTYSLQLSLYKYMIEKLKGIKISGLYLIHLKPKEYVQIECEYLGAEIEAILKTRKNETISK